MEEQRKKAKEEVGQLSESTEKESTNNLSDKKQEERIKITGGCLAACSNRRVIRESGGMTVSRELLHMSVRVKNKPEEMHKLPAAL